MSSSTSWHFTCCIACDDEAVSWKHILVQYFTADTWKDQILRRRSKSVSNCTGETNFCTIYILYISCMKTWVPGCGATALAECVTSNLDVISHFGCSTVYVFPKKQVKSLSLEVCSLIFFPIFFLHNFVFISCFGTNWLFEKAILLATKKTRIWATEEEDLDKERKVVLEEWRESRNAQGRLSERYVQVGTMLDLCWDSFCFFMDLVTTEKSRKTQLGHVDGQHGWSNKPKNFLDS